jgi:hypothetical protein
MLCKQMFRADALPFLLFSLLLSGSCQSAVSERKVLFDLSLIYEEDWAAVENEELTSFYEVDDKSSLEEAILHKLGGVSPAQLGQSFELCAWMLIVLENGATSASRRQALALLSNHAGYWISNYSARLIKKSTDSLDIYSDELSSAVLLLSEAQTAAAVEHACKAILKAYTPDLLTASRLLLGLSSKVSSVKIDDSRLKAITSTALRMVVVGVQAAASIDSDVKKDALAIMELIEGYAS